MKLVKEIYPFVLGIIVCFFVFQLANTGRFVGVFINRFSPCEQNPMNSFPCFGIYDITAMGIVVIIGIILIVISIYKTIKMFRKKL
ncbi:MAG TPA: hypothetical protein DEB73_03190 [Candidatus Magasanikbacteria bacterium]|uniref:Uncharacterized protein n=2 Tax=Candidatus Magasanikiibacteriota TaxID=1752731 RepID=A0A0G0ZJN9_9BACT|nr:MAG: hypothetical protein UU49_C0009G0014 [Candidatus Magasanikbacteria bacterium GW2011_GWC2_41_17]KKS13158.1 MAG: hypothetical protein UU69_C0012G0006 [Candidatus Magasanikbacteria bacterium GW2011_GWA2_41_55]HBV58236.1 hypothetical protein [Candidatus Magasanikbacteria bacterium]HBX15823.1 hypothetical protein [Candidatus Magasanikbacteria bacterium]